MIHSFDIIAVRIEDKGGVIAGVINPLAGSTIILVAVCEGRLIETLHHGAVLRLKGDVMVIGQYAKCSAMQYFFPYLISLVVPVLS